MVDCAYYYAPGTISAVAGKTHADVLSTGYNYAPSLWNDYAYYRGLGTPTPPSGQPPWYVHYRHRFRTDFLPAAGRNALLLVQYFQRVQAQRATEAVILVHGSSVSPDFWFHPEYGRTYLNAGGAALHQRGYDVFAPYVTHESRFAAARRRIASAYGDQWPDLDVRRVTTLYDHLAAQGYEQIHIVGISYGGAVAMGTIRARHDHAQRGRGLIIEGWLPAATYVENSSEVEEWLPNFEMVFPSPSRLDFLAIPDRTWLAYGSCSAATYQASYAQLPPDRVLPYTGAHEFLLSVFDRMMEAPP